MTAVAGARRIVFLVDVETGTGFLLFYRGKNDAIGKNITIKNSAFRKRLLQYLDLLQSDIAVERMQTYTVPPHHFPNEGVRRDSQWGCQPVDINS